VCSFKEKVDWRGFSNHLRGSENEVEEEVDVKTVCERRGTNVNRERWGKKKSKPTDWAKTLYKSRTLEQSIEEYGLVFHFSRLYTLLCFSSKVIVGGRTGCSLKSPSGAVSFGNKRPSTLGILGLVVRHTISSLNEKGGLLTYGCPHQKKKGTGLVGKK